jgi:diaminohydroxyphosphoribosylaminopyrimidine deaminase/5-amino-6-(5-phosphoribosylamino)uracil reductase
VFFGLACLFNPTVLLCVQYVIFAVLQVHEQYMNRCFQLARLGHGQVAPNPLVGAVLVHQQRIIGEGWHRQFGQAHAEVNCINSVASEDRHLIKESTLYVSLEPCAHFGKTPPCSALIIQHRIPHVVIGCTDSFEQVNGKGIAHLQEAGVQVTTGVLQEQALALNRRFFTYHRLQRPYIILKWAQSANGFLAAANQKPIAISNAYTNRQVHQWRSQEAAIMVGANTAISDNPTLTTRLWPGKNPLRLLIDPQLRVPQNLKMFTDGLPTSVFNVLKNGQAGAVSFIKLDDEFPLLPQLLQYLWQNGINSVLVEGGTILLNSFIAAGLWDEARVITATTTTISKGIAAPALVSAIGVRKQTLQHDVIQYYQPHTPNT